MTEQQIDEISNAAYEEAQKYELEYGGCAQCTIAGIFSALNIESNDVFRATTGLTDGIGLTGDGHCGALSAGTVAISYLFGRKKEDFNKKAKLIKACILSKKLHDQFVEKYGTCRCYDIETKLAGRFFNFYDPVEVESAMKTLIPKCAVVVAEVAKMTTRIILEEKERESMKQRGKGSETS